MTETRLDAPLLGFSDPTLIRPLPPGIASARADVLAAVGDLAAIPEEALAKPWDWIGGSEEEIRYGAYRAAEALESAELAARTTLAPSLADERQAARILGPATAARWELHGRLIPMPEALLDADPGDEQWTVRLTLGHVISGQRSYAWSAAWRQGAGVDPSDPSRPVVPPETFWDALPDEATTEAAGSLDDLRARLDAILDLGAERVAGVPDDRMALRARWSGFPVTLGFRLARWSSHIREHAIQVDKTFAALGYVPAESARLVHHVLSAYGRAESAVFGRADADEAVAHVRRGAAEARAALAEVRAVAGS
jgi:DinB superfamily